MTAKETVVVDSTYTAEERAEHDRLTKESMTIGVDILSIIMRAEENEIREETAEETAEETKEESELQRNCHELERDYFIMSDEHKGELILSISRAIAISVCRKLEQAGAVAPDTVEDSHMQTEHASAKQGIFRGLIRDILQDRDADRARAEYLNTLYYEDFNDNGDKVQRVAEGHDEKTAATLCSYTMGDGSELVQVAACELLSLIQEQIDKGKQINLFSEYIVRELSRRVMIQNTDNSWRERETCIIRECFRSVRRSVAEQAKQRIMVALGYTYIEREFTDEETGVTETAYERLAHYADFGGEQIHRIGDTSATAQYTADEYILDECRELIVKMGLTKRQEQILGYRLQGYGERAIAQRLGISKQGVQKNLKLMREKARNCEELYDYITAKIEH